MFSFALTFVIFIAVMVIASLVFGGWVVFTVIRGFGRLFSSNNRYPPAARRFEVAVPTYGSIQCAAPGCRHQSPIGARFCRHCGRALPVPQRTALGAQSHA